MANDISGYLAQILSAVRGEDVRQAIHDAIERCYTDGTWPETGNTVDLQARNMINDIVGKMTNHPTELLLYPSTDADISPTNRDDSGYNLYGTIEFSLNDDPSKFDKIRVYYQIVRQPIGSNAYYSNPIILEFDADDFINTTSVVTGYNFGSDNQHLRIRRMDIVRDTVNYPTNNEEGRKHYLISKAVYWSWDGAANSAAVTREFDPSAIDPSTPYPVGAILKIVGVKYTNVTDAVQQAIENIHAGTIEDDTLVL